MITNQNYLDFKAKAIAEQPIRKQVKLSDIKFITMDLVEFAGLKIGLTRNGLKDIVKIIGFSQAGSNDIKNSIGEDGSVSILNGIKSVISKTNDSVIISVSPERLITSVSRDFQHSGISAPTYFDTFERIANDHNMEIRSLSFNPNNGNVSIEALADRSEFQVGNFNDEVFRGGISLSNTAKGIKLDPYMNRLVCTNGNITRQFEESFSINSMEKRTWEEFYRHLDTIEKYGFAPKKFNEMVIQSMESRASLYELEQGLNLIKSSTELIEPTEMEIFFKGAKHTYNQLHSYGIDDLKLNHDQKRNTRTALSHWDVINGITDFASHDYGYGVNANRSRHLQMVAGDMLSQKPNCANLLDRQPF